MLHIFNWPRENVNMDQMMAETLKIMYKTWNNKEVMIGIQTGTEWIIEADSWIMQNQGDEQGFKQNGNRDNFVILPWIDIKINIWF